MQQEYRARKECLSEPVFWIRKSVRCKIGAAQNLFCLYFIISWYPKLENTKNGFFHSDFSPWQNSSSLGSLKDKNGWMRKLLSLMHRPLQSYPHTLYSINEPSKIYVINIEWLFISNSIQHQKINLKVKPSTTSLLKHPQVRISEA